MRGLLTLVALLAGVFAPGTTSAELGSSRLYPARYAPGVSDPAQAERISVKEAAGVEGVSIELVSAGGEIGGRILGSAGESLVGVRVIAEAGRFEIVGLTGPDGSFSLSGVPAGDVWLRASTDDPDSREQRFAARYYPEAVSRATAQPLQLTEAESLVLPDWTLPLGSTLRGEVIASDSEGPILDIEVQLYRDSDGQIWQRRTDTQGRFSFRGLVPGSYRVGAIPARGTLYIPGWNGDVRSLDDAEPLSLEPSGDVSVSLRLDPGASIRGQLRSDGQNLPLPHLQVQAIARDSRDTWETISDEFGFFNLSGLPDRGGNAYFVYCPPMNQYYPGVPREEDARGVVVTEGMTVSRIDIVGFDPGDCLIGNGFRGIVRGTVDIDFSKLDGAVVTAWSETDTVQVVLTENGLYTMNCVPVGDYRIGFIPQGPFVTQYYDEVQDFNAAEFVAVDADTADGIQFDPLGASWIAGLVEDEGGAPISEATVTILDLAGQIVACGQADELGSFRIDRILDGSGLPSGEYYVRAESTVVGDPDVTPVLQPTISFHVSEDTARLWWSLPGPWWWELALYRVNLQTEGTEQLWYEPAGPRALSEWVDSPNPGSYRYRLEARPHSAAGGPESPWIEVWTQTAQIGAPLSFRAWPIPWNGLGRLTFGGAAATSFDESSLEIVSAQGRRIRRLSWTQKEQTLSWDGTDEDGRAVASGVYFAHRRTEQGTILSTTVIVVQR